VNNTKQKANRWRDRLFDLWDESIILIPCTLSSIRVQFSFPGVHVIIVFAGG
jgi:hypothetical protein